MKFLEGSKPSYVPPMRLGANFYKPASFSLKNGQLHDHTLAVIHKHKTRVIHEIDAIRWSAESRFGLSTSGIERTLQEMRAYATGISSNSQRFGHFRYDLAVFAHLRILGHYPGDAVSQLYVAQMSSNF